MCAGRTTGWRQEAKVVIRSARLAARQLFEREFRSVFFRSLTLTIALLIVTWIGLEALVSYFLTPLAADWPWLATTVLWLLGAGLIIGGGFLIGPVSALFAGIFLDEVAEVVEKRHYPGDQPGAALPMIASMVTAAKFAVVVIAANLLALALILLPGINFAIFFLVNAYLIGREYFEFAAMRFRSAHEAREMRRAHALEAFLAGLIIAGFMAVPLLNLLTPLFATAMMVHLHKALSAQNTPTELAATRRW
jgi:CysZ protein